MYYKSDVEGFLSAIWKMADKGSSCTTVFLSSADGWGKVIMHDGQIKAVRYQSAKGAAALEAITKLTKLQYQFREEKSKIQEGEEGSMDNQRFFTFFSMQPPSQSGDGDAAPAIAQAPGSRDRAESGERSPVFRKRKILVADDSRLVRKVLTRILLKAGYQVSEAEDGFKALGLLENEHHHLLLLDLVMPGIDGYKLLKYIRQHKEYINTPVFILTARDGVIDKMKGHMSDANEYLTKPVDEKVLLGKIREHLERMDD
jgi:CheY-like chemotaxis protein